MEDLRKASQSVGSHLETPDVLRRKSRGRWDWYAPEMGECLRTSSVVVKWSLLTSRTGVTE
jgi:hypothetical protein